MASETLLIVDDKASMRRLLEAAFTERGFAVSTAANGLDAIELVQKQRFAAVITDLSMPGKDGIEVLKAVKAINTDIPVIIITAYGTIETAVEAMRLGAADFIAKPFKLTEIEFKVDKLLPHRPPQSQVPAETAPQPFAQGLVGASEQTRNLLRMIAKIGPSRSAVLITGPSGTGKELVAKAIHEASTRRERPFVALNCAALAPGVLESELFGHEKGAFTGAVARRIGRFEKAHTGTLFLDEVGDIDTGIQTKLLRVLQEGEFERVGGMDTIRVDVRIVAATNRDLRQAIKEGGFREDFYYRLNVFSLYVPPLRMRRDDIPALVDHFLHKYSAETGKMTPSGGHTPKATPVNGIDDDVMDVFMRYPWPGNVRELENVLERAVVLAERETVAIGDLPEEMLAHLDDQEPQADAGGETGREDTSLIERTDRLESELILGALERFHWNKTKTAEHLGLKRTTLQYKIRKYRLE